MQIKTNCLQRDQFPSRNNVQSDLANHFWKASAWGKFLGIVYYGKFLGIVCYVYDAKQVVLQRNQARATIPN